MKRSSLLAEDRGSDYASDNDIEAQDNLVNIKVKTLTNIYSLAVPTKIKIVSLRRKIVDECLKEKASGKRVRLIYAGKLLDDSKDLSMYKIQEHTCIHAALSEVAANNGLASSLLNRHSSNSSENNGGEEENLRGFDRLRQNGDFSVEDVEIVRSTFYREVLEYAETQRRRPGEEEADRYYRMEEEWISRQGPTSDFVLNVVSRRQSNNSNGTEMDRLVQRFLEYRRLVRMRQEGGAGDGTSGPDDDVEFFDTNVEGDNERASNTRGNGGNSRGGRGRSHLEFFVGFILGFFLGVIMLCFVWDENLSKFQRAGVLTGVAFNMYLQMGGKSEKSKSNKAAKNSLEDGSTLGTSIGDGDLINPATIFH